MTVSKQIRYEKGSTAGLRDLRRRNPDMTILDKRPRWYDLAAAWFAIVGIWPAWDPPHNLTTVAGVIDLSVHAAAWFVVGRRWKLARR